MDLAGSTLERAVEADANACPEAVDLYYQAALLSWSALDGGCGSAAEWGQAAEWYHASLARLLVTARRESRVIPGQGLLVNIGGCPRLVPLKAAGFAWTRDDFQELYPVGPYRTQVLSRVHRRDGWGTPVVVRRGCRAAGHVDETYLAEECLFAATAVLRPLPACGPPREPILAGSAVLEMHNPLCVTDGQPGSGPVPLAADLSAPFVWFEAQRQAPGPGSLYVDANNPRAKPGLSFLEPYQPGKIPVVFIHGLLSSPLTWVELVNDLRAVPGFTTNYQVWFFRYAMTEPFCQSASNLRRDLHTALETLDSPARDPALRQMVLVGHSMGGLIAKLQVISSGEALWRSVSRVPVETLVADGASQCELKELFYFEPQPWVRRVVFVATPHAGCNPAQVCGARLADCAALRDPAAEARFAQLLQANPGAFSPELKRSLPTHVDLLEPDSRLLQAIRCRPVCPGVHVHSIIGDACRMGCRATGDGVVTVDSAHHPADSQLYVRTSHTRTHHDLVTLDEIARILREHLAEVYGERPRSQVRRHTATETN